jgi:hypothetical protein
MKRSVLFASAAAALVMIPSAALAGEREDGDPITFENHASTTVWNASYELSATALYGSVFLYGTIDPDSAAIAVTDAKQIQSDTGVTFSASIVDLLSGDPEATATNNAGTGDVNGDGNVGVNVAAGQYNMQQNSANMAVSADPSSEADGGWASASTTGYQSLTDTFYGPGDISILGYDIADSPYSDTNTAAGGNVGGSGNVGVNVAAGAFNQQQNLMTLAVANNSVLSQSNAVLWQTASCNDITIDSQTNSASSGVVNGSGNLGVNIAAGVGNQQQNSLTAAVSGPFGG